MDEIEFGRVKGITKAGYLSFLISVGLIKKKMYYSSALRVSVRLIFQ